MIPKSDQKSLNWLPKMVQMATKKHFKSMLKISSQNKPKNLDFGLQNGLLLGCFGIQNRPLKALGAQLGAKT